MTNNFLTPDNPEDADCTDFTLHDPNQSIWLSIGRLQIYIRQATKPNSIAIEITPLGETDDIISYLCLQQPTKRRPRRSKVS